ncbi:MAG: N-formylglutamate amidohydrolase [Steroidobacteraceae bacterium]
MPLLQSTEPPAFTMERKGRPDGLLIACDHASNRIPAALGSLGLSPAQLQTHVAWDIGARAVAVQLGELLDATVICQNYSRLVIDCNRPLEAPDSIAPLSEAVSIAANLGLTDRQRQERQNEIFHPYHQALREAIGSRTTLISMHSFTPVYHGIPRRWHTGMLFQRDGRIGQWLHARLSQDPHLHVGENEPYAMDDATDYTLIQHGERSGIPHVGIEVRQDLIADVAGQSAWAQRLAAHLRELPDY